MQVFIAEKGSVLLVEKLRDTLFHAEKIIELLFVPQAM